MRLDPAFRLRLRGVEARRRGGAARTPAAPPGSVRTAAAAAQINALGLGVLVARPERRRPGQQHGTDAEHDFLVFPRKWSRPSRHYRKPKRPDYSNRSWGTSNSRAAQSGQK